MERGETLRNVEVTSYNEAWPAMFEKEADSLRKIFGEVVPAIHHIGSTAVPGLHAKPVIDILPVVTDISVVDTYEEKMAAHGYEAKGENGIAGRRFFQKGGDDRTHHVHVFPKGSSEIVRHLAFRDYLRAHKRAREKYGRLKAELAVRFPEDIDAYIAGKNNVVKEIEKQAMIWYRTKAGRR